jgi:hypothetical protein
MGGFAHTGVADATVRAQYASAGQVQDSAFTFLTSPAGTNTITATASLGMSAYVTGQRFFFVAAATNTGACTLNINAIGVKSVTKNGTTALVAGDIVNGAVTQVVYDGTQFQLLNPASATVSSFNAGSTGLTPSTATTGAVTLAGTLAVANGGTNNASLAVTAGGTLYTDGSKVVNVGAGTSGQVLTSNGASAPTWNNASGTLNNIQYFTTVGTATYTPTSGTTFVVVEVQGGGGSSANATADGSGGGGAGGYSRKRITSAFSGVTVTVGGAGGTSSFGALCSATGGATGTVSNTNGVAGGSGSGGDLNIGGSRGTPCRSSAVYDLKFGGDGGTSFFGGAGNGSNSGNGNAATGYGSGAGGANGGSYSGATGASGIVIVYEYK